MLTWQWPGTHFLVSLCCSLGILWTAFFFNQICPTNTYPVQYFVTINKHLSCICLLDLIGRSNDIKLYFFFFKRSALSHMRPMSLSVTSPDRPTSLSHDVLEEIENFLHSVVRYDVKNIKFIFYFNLKSVVPSSTFMTLIIRLQIVIQCTCIFVYTCTCIRFVEYYILVLFLEVMK